MCVYICSANELKLTPVLIFNCISIFSSLLTTVFNTKGEIVNVQHYEYDLDGNLQSVTYDRSGDGKVEYEKEY